jgi:hypothetical protein
MGSREFAAISVVVALLGSVTARDRYAIPVAEIASTPV